MLRISMQVVEVGLDLYVYFISLRDTRQTRYKFKREKHWNINSIDNQ